MTTRLSVLLLALALALSGCAPIEREFRYSLDWLDREAVPQSTGGKLALAPLALPVGLVAWVIDGVVIRFGLVGDDAWGDTVELLWELSDDTSDLFKASSLPLRALLTPVVFVGDFAGRWLLPIPDREDAGEGADD